MICSENNLVFDKYIETDCKVKIYDMDYLTSIFDNIFINSFIENEMKKTPKINKILEINKMKNNKKNLTYLMRFLV